VRAQDEPAVCRIDAQIDGAVTRTSRRSAGRSSGFANIQETAVEKPASGNDDGAIAQS